MLCLDCNRVSRIRDLMLDHCLPISFKSNSGLKPNEIYSLIEPNLKSSASTNTTSNSSRLSSIVSVIYHKF